MLKKIKDKKNKGFTLAELLIVVAIIAVLVAIAIPIFTAQLEKSREATDAANLRAAYAEVTANQLQGESTDSNPWTKTVAVKQQTAGWATSVELPAAISVPDKASGSWTVSIDSNGSVTVD